MSIPRPALLLFLYLPWFFGVAHGQTPAASSWVATRAASNFDRSFLPDPVSANKIQSSGSLSGAPGNCCIIGSVDYDFDIPASGWYELGVAGSGLEAEYLF